MENKIILFLIAPFSVVVVSGILQFIIWLTGRLWNERQKRNY
jgi:hypothetical protein